MTRTSHSLLSLMSVGKLDHSSEVIFLLETFTARVLVFITIACIFRTIAKLSPAILVAVTGGVAITGFLVTGMIFQFSSVISIDLFLTWLIVGGVLLGLGDALITLLWARFSATFTSRTVYLYVVLCNALSLIVYFIVTLLPNTTPLPIAAVLFLASVFFVKKALEVCPSIGREYSAPVFKDALKRMSHPILGTSILCFMAGLMLQISGQQEIPLSSFQQKLDIHLRSELIELVNE